MFSSSSSAASDLHFVDDPARLLDFFLPELMDSNLAINPDNFLPGSEMEQQLSFLQPSYLDQRILNNLPTDSGPTACFPDNGPRVTIPSDAGTCNNNQFHPDDHSAPMDFFFSPSMYAEADDCMDGFNALYDPTLHVLPLRPTPPAPGIEGEPMADWEVAEAFVYIRRENQIDVASGASAAAATAAPSAEISLLLLLLLLTAIACLRHCCCCLSLPQRRRQYPVYGG